jgi:uncharacterized membrane protein
MLYPRVVEGSDLSRVNAFTDGVFAIAITLLVLGLDVPRGDHEITRRVLDNWPDLLAYFLSFAVIGRFWMAHHRFFATLKGFDGRLMGLNLLYLSFVVLVPFTTELLGDHGDDTVTAVVYATVLGLAGVVNWVMIRHTLSRGHVREAARPDTQPFGSRTALVVPGIFFVSVPVAFLSPHVAEAMWVALFFVFPVRRRWLQRARAVSATTPS